MALFSPVISTIRSLCNCSSKMPVIFLSELNKNWNVSTHLNEIPRIKFHTNLSSLSLLVTFVQTDGRGDSNDRATAMGTLKTECYSHRQDKNPGHPAHSNGRCTDWAVVQLTIVSNLVMILLCFVTEVAYLHFPAALWGQYWFLIALSPALYWRMFKCGSGKRKFAWYSERLLWLC